MGGQAATSRAPDSVFPLDLWGGVASTPYWTPFVITQPVTIRARAFSPDAIPSPILTATYLTRVATPTITPPGGAFGSSPIVSISTSTPSATIRYTLNGDVPTPSSAPSHDAVEVYVSSAPPPVFPGTISPVGAAVTGFSAVGGSATFSVTGATLNPASVGAYRNGTLLNVSSTSTSFSVSGLADGRNRLDVTGEDAAGRPFELTAVVWAGTRTVTVYVVDAGNSPLPGAQVLGLLAADDSVTVSGTADALGRASLQLTPGSESVRVQAWRAGYRVAETIVTPGQTTVTIALHQENNNFSSGLNGWVNGAGINAWTLPHSETFQGWVPCPDCIPRSGFAGDEQAPTTTDPDNDLTVTNKNTLAPQTVSRRFRTKPGTAAVTVRYRFATTEFQSTTPRNDTFQVTLLNTTTAASMTDNLTVTTLPNIGNGATAWRTMTVAAQADHVIDAVFTVTNAVDQSFMSIIIVDEVYEQGVQVSALELYDYLMPPRPPATPRPERLSFLSASSHSWFGGMTRVRGAFTVIGGPSDSLQSLTLEVLDAASPSVVRATAPLHSSVTGVLGMPFGTAGVSVSSPRLLFEIPSSQLQSIDQHTNGLLILRVRATTAAGLSHTRELGRRVTKLVRYSGTNRYGGRDDTSCIVPAGSPWQNFECGGDSWAVPSIRLDTASLPGVVVNDFSNMNGGFFPIHTAHRQGRDVDVKWAGGANGDFAVNGATATRLIDLFNTPAGGQMEYVYVTFPASTAPGSFWQTIRNATVGGVRLIPEDVAQQYETGVLDRIRHEGRVRWARDHLDHFHIRWRDY